MAGPRAAATGMRRPNKIARGGPLKTLRATPQKGFPKIKRTYDYIQFQVQFFGQTSVLERSKGKQDYWDIEFTTRRGAQKTLRSCRVNKLDFSWAPRNIEGKKPEGRPVVTFLPPRFDRTLSSEKPSLPAPCNNPYPNRWKLIEDGDPEEAEGRYPTRVQPEPVSPEPPFDVKFWPGYPMYSEIQNARLSSLLPTPPSSPSSPLP